MFSSTDYIQLVFANWNDTYYCDDLLQLDLERYLWRNLHEDGYKSVYFVNENQGRLEVSVYKEKNTRAYSEKKSLKGRILRQTEDVQFVEWVQEQLRESKCAFVWPIEVFCGLKKRGKAPEQLDSQKRLGKILLVVPPHAETAGRYLLEKDSVFDLLKLSYIAESRDELTTDYYQLLKQKGRDRCLFLNGYTKERLIVLLKHIAFRYFEWYTSEEDLRRMGEYLAYYLNNRCMQWDESIFEKDFDTMEPMYSALYAQLSKESVWNRLAGKSRAIREAKTTVSKYLKEIYPEGMIESPEKREVWIFPERDSVEWKCRMLFPKAEKEAEQEHREQMNELCHCLNRCGNGQINKKVYGSMENFLKKAEHIAGGYPLDAGTYRRIVRALQFCSEQRYGHENEAIQKMLSCLEGYIAASEALFTYTNNYHAILRITDGQPLSALQKRELDLARLKKEEAERRVWSMDTGLQWLLGQLSGETITEEQNLLAKAAEDAMANAMKKTEDVPEYPVEDSSPKPASAEDDLSEYDLGWKIPV